MTLNLTTPPDFITVDTEREISDMIAEFEEITGRELYPAQDETILIKMFAQRISLKAEQFNEAARNTLARFATYPFLDYIGEDIGCKRLNAEKGYCTLQINLYEPFTYDFTIESGMQVLSKDEKYIFTTSEEVIIPSGETSVTVEIFSNTACEEVNQYGIGDINILLKPMSYIESVTNITKVTGGTDRENDKSYFNRICLAPESFTCAGSKLAYIYHTMSAHTAIIDAQAESPQIPATIVNNGNTYTESNGNITTEDINANFDYTKGICNLTVTNAGNYKITIPPAATVNIYPLTEEDVLPDNVKTAVEEKLNGENVIPMTDYVNVISPEKIDKTINVSITLTENADEETVKALIKTASNNLISQYRKNLALEIIPSYIISVFKTIDGVYDVDLNGLTKHTANLNQFFNLNLDITYQRRN